MIKRDSILMNKVIVIVIGVDHFNTLGIIRSLGEVGIQPIALILSENKSKAWTLKSRYININCSEVIGSEQVREKLLSISSRIKQKAYIIPSCDRAVKLIEEQRIFLSDMFHFPTVSDDYGSLTNCLDKSFTSKIASKAGFVVPKSMTFYANDNEQIKRAIADFAGLYPLIIKEVTSVAGKNHTRIIRDEEELIASVQECGSDIVLLQQFIQKDEELGVQGVGFGDGRSFVPANVHKIRTSLDAMGSTTYAILSNPVDELLKKKCEAFISELKYSGIFDIEVLRKGSIYYFIECNFRNGAYGYAYTRMGYNLPLIWILNKPAYKSTALNKRIMNVFNDIKHVKTGKISAIRWLGQMITTDVFLTANIKDPLPLFYRLFDKIK